MRSPALGHGKLTTEDTEDTEKTDKNFQDSDVFAEYYTKSVWFTKRRFSLRQLKEKRAKQIR